MYEAIFIVSTWKYIALVGSLVIVSYKFSACNYCLVQLFTCFCPFRNSAGFLLWSEWGRGTFKGGLISDYIFNLVPIPPKMCEITVPQYLNFNQDATDSTLVCPDKIEYEWNLLLKHSFMICRYTAKKFY